MFFCRQPDGALLEGGRPNLAALEFIRGGVVRAWAAWEAYLSELVEETYEVALTLATRESQSSAAKLRNLTSKWPHSRIIIQNQIKQRLEREVLLK